MPSEFPLRERVELAAVYEPTEKIGGDFYDFVDFPDGRLGMFIADVSGHGLPAAMIASIGKILLSVFGPNVESPGDLFFSLNSQLHERLASYFLTGFFGILSPDRALLSYATAGHPPPFLVREGAVRPLTGRGRPVGFWKNIEYETHDVKLLPGDRIVLYTDGLTEATNEASRMYGEEGMIHSMESAAKSPLGFFLQKIIQDARQFQGGGVFLDDVTLVGVDLK